MSELWQPAPRGPAATAAHAAAEADRNTRPERYRLDADHIVTLAAKRPDDIQRFAPGWRDGLEQYLASAAGDGRLNAVGTAMVVATAVGRLRAGAAMSRHRESRGDSALTDIPQNVFKRVRQSLGIRVGE